MTSLSIYEVHDHFPAFLSRVEAGEEIILERSGKPIAKIVPLKKGKRTLGKEKGKIWMSDDFNDPLPEDLLSEFYR